MFKKIIRNPPSLMLRRAQSGNLFTFASYYG